MKKKPTRQGERLQKVLARAGFASRREIERWIEQGRIFVNDKPAELGQQVWPGKDKIKVNGKLVPVSRLKPKQSQVLIYNKPVGEVCTRKDPENRKTVFQQLPRVRSGRWVSVGRLDINTAGLILFTTDGELANQLMHPSFAIEREYAVRVLGEVTDEVIEQLKTGVLLEDGVAKFEGIRFQGGAGANQWYHVVIKEGRNREVRRLWEAVGLTVSRLQRVRYGNVALPPRLRTGQWAYLEDAEVRALKRLCTADQKQGAGSKKRG
jgi:23S rRNA pseudouridine2605 synthase